MSLRNLIWDTAPIVTLYRCEKNNPDRNAQSQSSLEQKKNEA